MNNLKIIEHEGIRVLTTRSDCMDELYQKYVDCGIDIKTLVYQKKGVNYIKKLLDQQIAI